MFLGKGFLKICSKFTAEHPCRSVISITLLRNFIEIALRHGCSPVSLQHIFRHHFIRTPTEVCYWVCGDNYSTTVPHAEGVVSSCSKEQQCWKIWQDLQESSSTEVIFSKVLELGALTENVQKQPEGLFYKKAALKNFAIYRGEHFCWSLN